MIEYINVPNNPHKFKQFYCTLDDAYLTNDNASEFFPKEFITVVHENKYVKVSIDKDSEKRGDPTIYLNDDYVINPSNPLIIEEDIFLLYDNAGRNYAHFWFDFFGRLYYYDLLKKSNPNLKLGIREEHYEDKGKCDYIKQVINLCYGDISPVIFKSKESYKIQKLVIPNSFYWFPEGYGHEPIIDKVKKMASNIDKIEVSTNGCYISRQDTIKRQWNHKRNLLNEIELIDKIKINLNYDIIELMDYDIIGKIQIFKSYKNIIQQNGAANVNVMFSGLENTHIIISYPKQADWMNSKLNQFCNYIGSNLIVLEDVGVEISQDEEDDNNPWKLNDIDNLIDIFKQIDDGSIWDSP
tara:strand:- start:927 stop:1988 length:1062 start_codon:yes stop_codon:yes gene_type:complete